MTGRERQDPYIVLGVTRHASGEEIARAYRRAARASHPDGGSAGTTERFQAVSDAYEVLRDPRRRAVYDRSHARARPQTAETPRGSVRYAAPGSQHVVLGPPAQSAPAHPHSSVGDVEEVFRLTLSILHGNS